MDGRGDGGGRARAGLTAEGRTGWDASRRRIWACGAWLWRIFEPILSPMAPETRYARSGDVNIAYQVTGRARETSSTSRAGLEPRERSGRNRRLAKVPRATSVPSRGSFLFDKRGTGLSDRVSLNELPTLEQTDG